MKYLKTYEKLEKYPFEIGDYIIVNSKFASLLEYNEFINNNIGKVIKMIGTYNYSIYIEYDITNATDSILNCGFYSLNELTDEILINSTLNQRRFIKNKIYTNITMFYEKDIIKKSKNKEDLELYLISKKYNI